MGLKYCEIESSISFPVIILPRLKSVAYSCGIIHMFSNEAKEDILKPENYYWFKHQVRCLFTPITSTFIRYCSETAYELILKF